MSRFRFTRYEALLKALRELTHEELIQFAAYESVCASVGLAVAPKQRAEDSLTSICHRMEYYPTEFHQAMLIFNKVFDRELEYSRMLAEGYANQESTQPATESQS